MIPYQPIPVFDLWGFRIGAAPLFSFLGFLVLGILSWRRFRTEKIAFDTNKFLVFMILLTLSSLGGGRIWHFAENWQDMASLKAFFNPYVAGLTSYGMILGGVLFLILWARKNPVKGMSHSLLLARYCDVVALYTPLFVAIYRVGCYFHGCCYGIRTKVPWALHYIGTAINRHPTQLYEMGSALIIFGLLNLFLRAKKTTVNRFGRRFDGEIALWFLLLYGTARFVIDFFRYYPTHHLGLALSQWVCCMAVLYASTNLFLEYCTLARKSLND